MWGYAMSKNKPSNPSGTHLELGHQVGVKESRKLRAQREGIKTIWYGLGMMGLIGWSVTIPTIAGTFLGIWLDVNYPVDQSWTLVLLVVGLFIGCYNAMRWIKKEGNKIKDEQEEKKDE